MGIRGAAVAAAGLIVGGALPIVTAGPAHACSCVGWNDNQAFSSADAVFAGRLRDAATSVQRNRARLRVFDFDVDTVYKGAVLRRQRVVTIGSGSSCGAELRGNGPFLVFATRDRQQFDDAVPKGELFTGLCDGTREVADRAIAFRAASGPFPGASPPLPEDPADAAWIAAGGAAALLTAVATITVVLRRRRSL